MIKVTAKQAFIHDAHRPARGDQIEVSESLAAELEKRGLIEPVQTKQAPDPSNKMAAKVANKGDK